MSRPKLFRMHVESLEHRLALAGNVTVALTGNNLVITGDASDNEIQVFRYSPPSVIRIQSGQNNPTKINGSSSPLELTVPDNNRLTINMNGGKDKVVLNGKVAVMNLSSLAVDMGAGADILEVIDVNVTGTGTTNINMGTNAQNDIDRVTFATSNSSSFAGNLSIRTGGSGDDVTLGKVTVNGNLLVDTGPGVDYVVSFHCNVGNMTVNLNDANPNSGNYLSINNANIAGSLNVNGGAHKDTVGLQNVYANSANVRLMGGNDILTVSTFAKSSGPTPAASFFADLGAGDDLVELSSFYATNAQFRLGAGLNNFTAVLAAMDNLEIEGGANVDMVNLGFLTTKNLTINLGAGDDQLTAGSTVIVQNRLRINGGAGKDKFFDGGIVKPIAPNMVTIVNITVL